MRGAIRKLLFLALSPMMMGCVSHETSLTSPPVPDRKLPNILVIVADDMGYSDIAPFGSEIATPNLAKLASRGIVLSNFHTAPTCSPTRAMLLTGRDNHLVGLGVMAETLSSQPHLAQYPGYQGHLASGAPTLAGDLRKLGYQTLMAGKWHLGQEKNLSPRARGFDRSFALLGGAANHFGRDQDGAWLKTLAASSYREDGELTRYPEGRYSTDVYTDHMLSYLDGESSPARPFFAYVAFTAPHWPLQAPSDVIAKYSGRYDRGWAVLRSERFARAKRLGIVPQNAREEDLPLLPDWEALNPAQQRTEARKMEIYAAMIDHMDESIGRIFDLLARQGRLENTIVFFMSDNGPAGTGPNPQYLSTDPDTLRQLAIDNSFDNMGKASSFVSYNRGWAIAGATPFKGLKGATFEGGIRTSAIIAGPGIDKGRIEARFTHVMDVKPTLEWLVGRATQHSTLGQGQSWNFLSANVRRTVRNDNRKAGWEFSLDRAVRSGGWKAVWRTPLSGRTGASTGAPGEWELYDVANDLSEKEDVSKQYPAKLREMKKIWSSYKNENGVLESDRVLKPSPPQ